MMTMRQIETLIQPLRDSAEIENTFSIAGQNGNTNRGFMVLSLAEWNERTRTQQEIVADVSKRVRAVPGIQVFASQPNSLGIRGAGNGLQFAVVGTSYAELGTTAAKIVSELEKDPRFDRPRLTNEPTQPQLAVTIDRERASDLGIDITGLAQALQSVLDGYKIGSVYIEDRSFDVKLVSTTDPINDPPTDLENVFLRTQDGRFVPMSTIARLTEVAVPPALTREQQMRSVAITASLSPSFALGDAYAQAQAIAEPLLPAGYASHSSGPKPATLGENSSSMIITFGFAILIILLVLAAQFESFISAVIVMATVPLGLACAVFAMVITGTSMNVYSQIGLVLLVGIMAKNGILIVEFANHLRDQGRNVRQAIEEAATIRLRPVVMTMLCAILGGVPLVLASGAGAEARIALGWVIVGGLGLATASTLFLTPVAYLLLAGFSKPKAEEEARLQRELLQVSTKAQLPAE